MSEGSHWWLEFQLHRRCSLCGRFYHMHLTVFDQQPLGTLMGTHKNCYPCYWKLWALADKLGYFDREMSDWYEGINAMFKALKKAGVRKRLRELAMSKKGTAVTKQR